MALPDLTVVLLALGLLSGPWLGGLVVAHSVAYRQPLRQHCPVCGVVTVDVTRGGVLAAAPPDARCRQCRSPTGPAPGLLEVVAAAVLCLLAVATPSVWVLAAWSWTALLGIALAFIDVAVLRLPDVLTIAAGLGSLGLPGVAAVATDSPRTAAPAT
ncbi:hypothetical protein GCM10009557_03650 [Virgisporangium ochraceum]|uniref:Prepilin peptidase n=1 Tax=Virgisporangium ochraceum TaxID=65505 RepID=A0A8J4A4U5_9ACTN|nr:hypothetical protein [Virgisporangium ochraceum]GIJ72756.1 hypothetical protein Voc01_076730 [Virgisporangium ochraceum]